MNSGVFYFSYYSIISNSLICCFTCRSSTAVFAPTDDAFAAVEGLEDIIADKEALTTLLQNHVVVRKTLLSDLVDGQKLQQLVERLSM